MKSPTELKVILQRQWENPNIRESRLLSASSGWPILLPIGPPSPRKLNRNLDEVKRHVEEWRQVRVGEVIWERVRYRATSASVDIPISWKLKKPTEWIDAIGDSAVRHEFQTMANLVEHTPSDFHSLFIRRRSLWSGKPIQEVLQAANLANSLAPGCAQGRPLRLISLEGIDTKFFERHSNLVTTLLDARFDGEVSRIGLEDFLGAFRDGDHWLLIVALDSSILPFKKLRVRSSELRDSALPGSRLLIIENEACQHQLPNVTDTIAVLGAGFALNWTDGPWLTSKKVAYWGDIDTWGLQFLARARTAIPHLDPLLMTEDIFKEFEQSAVSEPVVAGANAPAGLTNAETKLYRRLIRETRGRLEQEFLPLNLVHECIFEWAKSSTDFHSEMQG